MSATTSVGVAPKAETDARTEDRLEVDAGCPADEGGDEHRPLDADVHDTGAFAHDAAQGGEPDRHGRLQDDRRDERSDRDEVADELEDEPEDRDPVQELVHQRIVASPP